MAFAVAGVVFLTRATLGDADQSASVGSFLLTPVALEVTAVVALEVTAAVPLRCRRPDDPPPAGGSRITIKNLRSSGYVQIGDDATASLTNNHYAKTPAAPDRKD
ncbi:hypothetical protein Aph02nite_65600 [Actinoplanes philippinensis]|uniref:Uncharacterized protein n=1 Tax=Actinoplanes philippinensis TaxID=35752 RepID=A0A1I2LHD2_9ACTN|nr:hypothetical protein [Actinoplanes philippinensis]GIE80610.1 hypothetical protein Aph02nite_65600 [Actinoplanes philippinensis]SFF76486.1 hypothetical protein SAMN05421541_12114 [Actinoplanes philippinensis]